VYRTPVTPLVERMLRVVQKLNPQTRLSLSTSDEDIVFAGEREDLEELLGNLLENAMKWAKTTVMVSVARTPGGDALGLFEIGIEDDGPGIPEEKAREALQRGRRLDETKPGTGLGLAIVADLVNEYGGTLALERSSLGGLKAIVRLRSLS
jgi:signal transduction histidine kinase